MSLPASTPSTLTLSGGWQEVFKGAGKTALEQILPDYIAPRRWFGSKTRTIQATEVIEAIPIAAVAYMTLLRITYREGEPEFYQLPLTFTAGEQADSLRREQPQAVVTNLETEDGAGVLYDAVWSDRFCTTLFELMAGQQNVSGLTGELLPSITHVFAALRGAVGVDLSPALLGAEQSNTSIRYGEQLILKLFRRLERGVNPDLEIGHFLTEKAAFAHIPGVAGALEYRQKERAEPITLAILQGFVPNQGDAWRYTLESLRSYFEPETDQTETKLEAMSLPQKPLVDLAEGDIPALASEMIGSYLESARLLGQRTAELHLALASDPYDPDFAPQPFTEPYQRLLHQRMCQLTEWIFQLLPPQLGTLPEPVRIEAQQVIKAKAEVIDSFQPFIDQKITALRTRIHGDYHLGQVLYTGQDFMIIDFEGEPARTLEERRLKRSPLQDVAGMLRSFHYAAYAAFFEQIKSGIRSDEKETLEARTRFWHLWVSVAFLKTYLTVTKGAIFRPESLVELKVLLDAYLLEKAIYELGYELNNRPDWINIPIQGILQTLRGKS